MVGPLERPSRRSRASERPSRRSRPNRARILPKNVARRKKKTKTGLRTLRLRVVGGGRPRLSLGVPPRRLERLERSPAGPGIPGVPDPRGPRLAPRAPPERVVVRRPRIQARARRRRARRRGARGSVVTRGAQAPRARVRARRRASAAPPAQTAQRRVRPRPGPAQRAQPTAPAEAPARAPNDPPRRVPPIEVVFRSSDRRPESVFASRRAATPTLLILILILLARRRRLGRRSRRRRGRLSPRAHLPLVRLDADGAERKRPRRVDHVQAVHEPADDGSPRAALGLAAALVRMMMPARRLHARPGVVLVRLPGAPPTFLPPPAPGALHHAHEEEDDHHRAEGDARRDVALDAAGAGVARRRRVASRDQARARRVVRAVARVVLRMRRFVFMGSGASVDRFSVSDQR